MQIKERIRCLVTQNPNTYSRTDVARILSCSRITVYRASQTIGLQGYFRKQTEARPYRLPSNTISLDNTPPERCTKCNSTLGFWDYSPDADEFKCFQCGAILATILHPIKAKVPDE